MSDEDDLPEEEKPPGSPAWVMTFADLMSLLLCFRTCSIFCCYRSEKVQDHYRIFRTSLWFAA